MFQFLVAKTRYCSNHSESQLFHVCESTQSKNQKAYRPFLLKQKSWGGGRLELEKCPLPRYKTLKIFYPGKGICFGELSGLTSK
jgi:hypothetical protein